MPIGRSSSSLDWVGPRLSSATSEPGESGGRQHQVWMFPWFDHPSLSWYGAFVSPGHSRDRKAPSLSPFLCYSVSTAEYAACRQDRKGRGKRLRWLHCAASQRPRQSVEAARGLTGRLRGAGAGSSLRVRAHLWAAMRRLTPSNSPLGSESPVNTPSYRGPTPSM